MKINELRKLLDITKSSLNIRTKELEVIKIESIICDEEGLLLDIKQELMEQEQKNIKELIEICNKYENKLEEIENEVK
jgi:hypothetical protein